MKKLLYRPSEAKVVIGVGLTRLYELINDGRLDARRFGRKTYITAESLERFVNTLEPIATPTMKKVEREAQGERDPEPEEAEQSDRGADRQSPRSRFGFAAPRPE